MLLKVNRTWKNMKKIIKQKYRILLIFIEFIALCFITFIAYNFIVPAKGTKTFYLPSSDIKTLTLTLEKNGYTVFFLDELVMQFITLPKKGWYTVKGEDEGRFFFFYKLHTQISPLVNIKIFAAETKVELTKRLANDMKSNPMELLQHYDQLSRFDEGDIIAGDYALAKDANDYTMMKYLFDMSSHTLLNLSEMYCPYITTLFEQKILHIIASIIQKESNNIDEMPLISSVIYNRLEKGMRLQMDGTLNYGKHSHTIVTSERIKTDTSLYNTYKHKGLPPAPLSSVSIDALKAACNPETSKYLFFMLTKDGTHVFADNYDEHLENVRAFKNRPKDENITNKNISIDTNKTSIENNTTSDSNISISHKRSVRKSSKSNKSKDSALE